MVALAVLASCSNAGDDATTIAPSTANPTDAPTTQPPTTAGTQTRVGDHDAVLIPLNAPDWLVVDESHIYVKLDSGFVEQLDPTGAVVGSAEISGVGGMSGTGCPGIGVGFDSVWTCNGADVMRFSLDSFAEVSAIAAQKTASQGHLAVGFGKVWVLQRDGSALAGIDPETEAVGESISLPVRGSDLAVGDDGVWIVSALDNAVIVIDPTNGTVLHRFDDVQSPSSLSILGADVWIGGSSAVHRIDQATAAIVSTFEGGIGRTGVVAADETGVWVRREAEVTHLDGATGAITDSFTLDLGGSSPGDMVVAFGSLWISASNDRTLFRIALD